MNIKKILELKLLDKEAEEKRLASIKETWDKEDELERVSKRLDKLLFKRKNGKNSKRT